MESTVVTGIVPQGCARGALRLVASFIAWAVGWVVYMIAMAMTVYDGFLSLIFQPFIAVFVSAIFVFMALIVGLVFRIPAVGRLWRASRWTAIVLIALSLSLMCFGSAMGMTQTFIHPDTGEPIVGLHSAVALSSYFFLLFAIANWPTIPTQRLSEKVT
jgi:hypothetical protein